MPGYFQEIMEKMTSDLKEVTGGKSIQSLNAMLWRLDYDVAKNNVISPNYRRVLGIHYVKGGH